MATIFPFAALRPARGLEAEVASPPYDVINTREARAYSQGKPNSYLFVSRPEIALAEGTDEHSDEVYLQGKIALEAMITSGALVADPTPRLYIYAQTMGAHRQVGLVGCASVDAYDSGDIKRHEKTRADKEDDRTRHIDQMGAHDEPVFLTYRAQPAIDEAIFSVCQRTSEVDITTSDGVRHELWSTNEHETHTLAALMESVAALYIADGHHRSAAASRVHALRAGQPGEHDRFLAVVFPHDQMQILPYNRLVRDLEGRSQEALLERLASVFELTKTSETTPTSRHEVGLFVGGQWYRARVRDGLWDASDPVASLDCSIVQERVLSSIFGVTDPRKDSHVDFVGGIRGTQELERRVHEEGWSLGISMFPTQIDELLAVSDAGLLMPPKSTWFEPKLRSGLFVHRM
ncbi:MAG: DUF1015 family protein [Deltaproteobacteria bacterium]|nr:DUF1015 family protein [Deltaproteobacteria bacterium]